MSELRLYRPSNGTEGDCFRAGFCDRCIFDWEWRAKSENPCDILTATMMLDTKDEGYPREWRYDATDNPVCTKFLEDNEDGDRPLPVEPDPTQLVMIADPTEDAATFGQTLAAPPRETPAVHHFTEATP